MQVNNIGFNQINQLIKFRGADTAQGGSDTVKKEGFLDKFETNVRNSADLNDTIKVPRTIFKGYLSFCAGSALMPIAAMIKDKFPKASMALNVVNAGLIIYGTYSFVRPYLVSPKKEPEQAKE